MRKLKYHERKLLKKVDFLHYRRENTLREISVLRQYQVENRNDYMKYFKHVSLIRKISKRLINLPDDDQFRISLSDQILQKLYDMGLINSKRSLEEAMKVTVASFCRRRFPVVLVRNQFAENIKQAKMLIEHGHVRIGPDVVKKTDFIVTRNSEDLIAWVDSSKIKRHVMNYREEVDDYDLLFA